MDNFFDSIEDATSFMVNLNRSFFLGQKEHIKKYYRARKVHSSVLDSMINYIDSDKFPIREYLEIIFSDIKRETRNINVSIGGRDDNDMAIFNELFLYKNHTKIPSLTEIYIDKKKIINDVKLRCFMR